MRIFPGPTERGVVAAPFVAPADLRGARGELPPEVVWAALDCTGYFAIVGDDPAPMLLGEIAAEIREPVGAGPHVVYGWSLGSEGRKARCGTAIATPEGHVLALASATWIRPRA